MILIWPILLYTGARAAQLRWQPFAIMLLVAVLGTVLYDYVAVNQAARAGHDETFRWRPIVLAVDVAVTTTLYALTYLFGYAVGKWWRNRKGPD